jgi:hypothetical protein
LHPSMGTARARGRERLYGGRGPKVPWERRGGGGGGRGGEKGAAIVKGVVSERRESKVGGVGGAEREIRSERGGARVGERERRE